MYFLYSILLTLGVVALLPRFIYDYFRHGKYAAGLRQRLGGLKGFNPDGRSVVWLHCVSVGEVQASRPLARALLNRFPNHALVVSTTTLTGQKIAREVFEDDAASVIYFPFDWGWTVRRALRAVDPSLVLIMETELWPRFLRACRRRGVPTAIVNGRLSERSFRRYSLVRRFIHRVLNDLTLALAQTEADAERFRALGLSPDRVIVTGNTKFDADPAERFPLTDSIRERFRLDDAPLIVAASTHAPEERIIIDAFQQLRSTRHGANAKLLLAPRHPERFAEVEGLLKTSRLEFARRSTAASSIDPSTDVILLDTVGELRAVYPLATIVFVGGSIAPLGGHNILEPALVGACTVTGAHTHNFAAIVDAFLEAGALVQLPALSERDAPQSLADAFSLLLSDPEKRELIGRNARAVIDKHRGATTKSIDLIAPLLTGGAARLTLPPTKRARPDALSA